MSITHKITNTQKHTVQCTNCKKAVLDHMTKCPFCDVELTPAGYKPMDEETKKRIKRIASIFGFALAAVVVIIVLLSR